MIVHVVLLIVIAVHVNSQQLCPGVCQCYNDSATCTNLFSDAKNKKEETFHSPLKTLRVTGITKLELEEDFFLRWNVTSLTSLDLSQNNVKKIWRRAFYSLADLEELDLSGNSITTLPSQTFSKTTGLVNLFLERNSITDIHHSTFQNNSRLTYLDISGNKINSIHSDTFTHNTALKFLNLNGNNITYVHSITFRNNSRLTHLAMSGNRISSIHADIFMHNMELEWLNLKRNTIKYIHPSTFRKNSKIRYLDLSSNLLESLEPRIFTHCTKLHHLSISANKISEISTSLFYGLEYLEHLDLSNNYIEELNQHVFDSFSISTNRQNHQVTNLKYLNLAQNKIQVFNFELYFPMSSNSDTYTRKFQLDYLNLSSNRLTTLDVASVKWLNQTTAVTDLTANPWNCDCSVLLEVWRELKHRLTLHCASPEQLQGKSWDVIEEFCSQVPGDMNNESKTMSQVVSTRTEHNGGSEESRQSEGTFVVTTILIVFGVLLVCAIGGIIIIIITANVVTRWRNKPKTPEYCDVYVPRASYVSVNSYAEVSSGHLVPQFSPTKM